MRLGETKCFLVAAAVGGDRRLEHDHTTPHIDDTERMLVAVRIDTDDVVQLICDHPDRTSSPVGGTLR
jgi:hypothetical protein